MSPAGPIKNLKRGLTRLVTGVPNPLGFSALIILGWIVLQSFFLNTAFRIDEPLFLAVTKQIMAHPLDPYGFKIDQGGVLIPVHSFLANPPLLPVYLASWASVFPWNEISLHLAVLPFSIIALFIFGTLAKRFGANPTVARLLLCCSPAFFLGSQVVMPDMAMLAMLLLSLNCAFKYLDSGSRPALWVSAAGAAACPLVKYNGLILVPLLFWIFLSCQKRRPLLVVAFVPVISLALWNLYSWKIYGSPHFLAMVAFEKTAAMTPGGAIFHGMAYLGLGVLPALTLAYFIKLKRQRLGEVMIAAVAIPACLALATYTGNGPVPSLLFAVSCVIASFFLLLCWNFAVECLRTRDLSTAFLVIWIIFGLALQSGVKFMAVRYMLFLAPPAIILILRQSPWRPNHSRLGTALAANLLLVIAIAHADAQAANGYRWIAHEKISPMLRHETGKLYYSGQWGIRYYVEQIGGQAFSLDPPTELKGGDLVVVAEYAWPGFLEPPLPEGMHFESNLWPYRPGTIIRTIGCRSSSNFYCPALFGCRRKILLPFGFGREPSEIFHLYRIRE